MKSAGIFLLSILLLAAVPAAAEGISTGQISGDYAELRTADVWTGPCFANGEVGLTGNDALMAWRIRKGTWNAVALDGLSVMAVVHARSTLGDPYSNPLPAQAVLLVDNRATEAQHAALVQFAQAQNPELLNHLVAVESSPIRFQVDEWGRHGYVTVEAGQTARISTRALREDDRICHNESVFYPPLAANLDHAMPAVAMDSGYQGNHLGTTWKQSNRRGAFVGTFSF